MPESLPDVRILPMDENGDVLRRMSNGSGGPIFFLKELQGEDRLAFADAWYPKL